MRFLLIAMLALLAGCVYRIDIQQGNYVTQDAVQKLKTGMTKAEVRSALGTPLLNDVFHQNRWDYYFSNAKNGRESADKKRFSVFFENDKLVSFTGEVNPAKDPPVGERPAPQVAR